MDYFTANTFAGSGLTSIANALFYTNLLSLAVIAGLFGYAIYATLTLARLLREIRDTKH